MSETTQEEKKEEEVYEVEPTVFNDSRKKKSHDKKIIEKVIELKNENKSFDEIAKIVKISVPTARKIWSEQIANLTIKKEDTGLLDKYMSDLERRYGEIMETTDRIHTLAKKCLDEFESRDMSDYKVQLNFMRSIHPFMKVMEEIRKQLDLLKTEQEQIKKEQKNLYFTPTQINQQLNIILNKLHREGDIKIVKKSLIKSIGEVKK